MSIRVPTMFLMIIAGSETLAIFATHLLVEGRKYIPLFRPLVSPLAKGTPHA